MFWPWLIIGLAVLIYGYSLTNGFIWDDADYLWKNPFVFSFQGLLKLWDMWSMSHIPLYGEYPHPIALSSFWLEHKLWGFNPWGYHTASLVLHILNALLLFGLLRKLAPPLAGVTTLLFTIHPIQVETVAWISEQKNLLCLFFFLLAFHSLIDLDGSEKKRDYFKMLFFFIAALLSKPAAICFAVVPFLYAWWKRGSVSRHALLSTLLFLFLGGLFSLGSFYAHRTMTNDQPVFSPEKIILAGKIFFFYIKQSLLPWQFLTFYPKWDLSITRADNWLFPAGVAVLYAKLYLCRHSIGRGAFTLLFFYGVSIFPAMGFLPLSFMQSYSYVADRFTSLSLGPVLLLAYSACVFLFSKTAHFWVQAAWRPSDFFKKSVLVLLALYLSVSSFFLTLNYKDSITLFSRLLVQYPVRSSFIYSHLGMVCLANLDLCTADMAVMLLEKAVEIGPEDNPQIFLRLGLGYEQAGLDEKVIQTYLKMEQKFQNPFIQAFSCRRIGAIRLKQKKFKDAAGYFEKAISLQNLPDYQKYRRHYREISVAPEEENAVYSRCGGVHFFLENFPRAIEIFKQAIALDPGNAENYTGMGASYINLRETQKALSAFQTAARLDPQNRNLIKNIRMAQEALKKSFGTK